MNFGLNKSARLLLFLVLGLIVLPTKIFAIYKTYEPAATSSEVVVVYNSSYAVDSDSNGVQDSLQIANYYKAARSIPDINIIGIAATTTEVINRSTYNSEIKTPLQTALNLNGLATTTKYIVLIKGMPLKIRDTNLAIGDTGEMGNSDLSSVDAAVCLLYQSYNLMSMYSNPYNADPGNSKDYRFKHDAYSNGSVYLDYLVTRLDGRSLTDVKAMIDRSVAAGPSSNRAWLLDANAGGLVSGYDTMSTTYTTLKNMGENVVPDPWTSSTTPITTSTLPVIGYDSYGTHAGLNGNEIPQDYYTNLLSSLSWAPGAVSVTYESYNGYSMASSTLNKGQGQIADFIAVGGSGGIANVYEPYSSAIARENIWAPAYARGYSWADSAYMSLPYMDWVSIVLGDPLMTIGDNVSSEATGLVSSVNSSNYIDLSWTNPVGDFSTSTVVRSVSGYPVNVDSGTIVYSGAGNSYTDTTVNIATNYYYSVFATDHSNNYGNGQSARAATTTKNTLRFASNSSTVTEAAGVQAIRVNFGVVIDSNKTFSISLSGSAIEGTDFSVSTTTINATTGQSYVNVPITILDDYVADGTKTIVLTLLGDNNWAPITNIQHTITISDNDVPGLDVLTTNINSVESATSARTLMLKTQPTSDVILSVSTSTLYSLPITSFTFTSSNWNVPQTLSMLAIDNSFVNVSSTSTITITATSADSLYNGTTTSFLLIIADNDANSIITDVSSVSLSEGGSRQIKVNLSTQPISSVAINISYGTGINGSPSQLIFNDSNWSTQQNINMFSIDNNIRDGSRNTNLTLSVETTDPSYLNVSKVIAVAIADDEGVVSSGGGGGGGGGGGSSSPSTSVNVPTTIQAVNQNLTIESASQAGSVSKSFYDNSWVKLSVEEKTVSSKTTFNVKNLEAFQVNLPLVTNEKNNETVQVAPINNMVIEVIASDASNNKVENFAKDLSFTIYIPQIAKDDKNLNLYYFDESLKKWIIVSNAIFDNNKKIVSFSVNHLTKFAVFKNTENKKELCVAADAKENVTTGVEPVVTKKDEVKPVETKLKPVKVKLDKNFANKQKGKLLLALENKGMIYYVDAVSAKRVQVDAVKSFPMLKKLALVVNAKTLKQVSLLTDKKTAAIGKKYAGRFLRVGNDVWYVNMSGKRQQITEAKYFEIIKKLAVGIKNCDLYKIEEQTVK